jgi:excisionase family DNA binding protein
MTIALETVLARAGLDVNPTRFVSYVEDAARRFSPPQPDPASYFSPADRDVLTDVGLDLSSSGEHDINTRARSIAAEAVLRESALTVDDAARRLGVDSSGIRRRLSEKRLVGWKDRGGWRLPAWQFTESGILPGLPRVLAAVPEDQPPLVLAAFFATDQPDLQMNGEPSTPRQWLLAGGDPTRVGEQASMLGTPL